VNNANPMFEAIAQFRGKLSAGHICLGAGITLSDSSVVEAVAPSVDFVWIDLEHTHLSYETVQTHLIAARAGGIAALVRVRGSDAPHIKPILDIGAGGIVVPQVQTVDEVQRVVDACRYSPLGQRGFGPRRASAYGREGGPQWMQQVNQQVFIGVQIENLSALAAVDEIANLEGFDSIVLGPYDLSVALGHPGDIGDPQVQSALKRIIAAARNGGKYVGTGLAGSSTEALKAVQLGVQWLQCGDDYAYMVTHIDELMRQIRATNRPTTNG
jgi:2-keto-3-deoxy-L-rhamnonate aldolase RhmA